MATQGISDELFTLRQLISGHVLTGGEGGYEGCRRVHNGMIDRHPAVIVRCLDSSDVVAALAFASAADLEIAVRGGGHNVAGRAVCDDGIMIDLSLMKQIQVDPDNQRVRVGAGVTWGEFNAATQAHGLATTGGAVSSTGVAGLTLGGGFGFLMGKYGYTIDNLCSAQVVTVSGELIQASKSENAELFWGLRGGGGNFGIVTEFEFNLHPLGPNVEGGMIAHQFSDARSVLGHFRDQTLQPADEMTVVASLTHAPDGSGDKLAALLACNCGGHEEAEAALQVLKNFGKPVIDGLGSISYEKLNQMLDPGFPKLALNYWKSCFVDTFSDAVIEILIHQFAQCPSPMSKLITEHFHGQALRVDPSATAYPHRQAGYSILIISQWQDPTQSDVNVEWARQTYARLEPHMRAASYSNYLDDDEPAGRVRQGFGENYQRLQDLKDHYDPHNLLHRNQNIAPTALKQA